ncbi:MAG: hypothetical protein ACYS0F_10705 [Planctomycetota bacterium]|jgi:hypothetical protein
MLNSLPELVARCADGDTKLQKELLDEVEPLVFGYTRSLGEPFERAVRLTHAAVLGFLLDVRAGRVRLADVNALRRKSHELATTKMADPDPWLVRHEGDPGTGALTPVAVQLAEQVETALDDTAAAARRFRGAPDGDDASVFKSLLATGVPERNA